MLAFYRLRPLLVLAALFLFAGCKQEVGEVCDLDSDCASGICCCGDMLPDRRGLCLADRSECDVSMCEPPDAGSEEDAGPDTDAGAQDAGAEDAGAEDAGSTDAGADAGAVDDAGTDAGVEDAGADAGVDAGTDAG